MDLPAHWQHLQKNWDIKSCRDERNQNLKASEYGAQIDPMGLRIVLNEYYRRYHLPLIITENGLGMGDELTADGRVHDDYRIDYLRQHVQAIADAIGDGVEAWILPVFSNGST